ncbi:MAG: hypothetical protein A2X12_02250 [Bacteroidetes bacterium GWE2_29_8]|nr:MAG: hypothetical protein A2X12_02250 [Bacteroidetes bacterium GWE2_29_8]OFY19172.1 MAG: hypothetical protein A2X02_01640 [Bacteroidetes bacterium GWF2_29_10]
MKKAVNLFQDYLNQKQSEKHNIFLVFPKNMQLLMIISTHELVKNSFGRNTLVVMIITNLLVNRCTHLVMEILAKKLVYT